jgi:hypothetical protein
MKYGKGLILIETCERIEEENIRSAIVEHGGVENKLL